MIFSKEAPGVRRREIFGISRQFEIAYWCSSDARRLIVSCSLLAGVRWHAAEWKTHHPNCAGVEVCQWASEATVTGSPPGSVAAEIKPISLLFAHLHREINNPCLCPFFHLPLLLLSSSSSKTTVFFFVQS